MRPRTRAEFAGAYDLHVHTTHSDGACSPGEVVRAAAALGLKGLAITDHDTVSALAVARPEAERLGLELIGGIEVTAEYEGREVHILGHFVDDRHEELVETTARFRKAREERFRGLVDRLASLGLTVPIEALSRAFPRATLGRRHLADYLVRSGQVADYRTVFGRYLGDNGLAQVPKPRLPWRDAIALIRRAGGVAGLAHPSPIWTLPALVSLRDGGLGAVEIDWPGLAANKGRRWSEMADRLGLIPIGGSDFHAADRHGRWLGAVVVPPVAVDRLRASGGLSSKNAKTCVTSLE